MEGDKPQRRHWHGLVHRLPLDVTDVMEAKVTTPLQQHLVRLGLAAEAQTFDLPHVTVVHIHSADPATPLKMLRAMPALPPMLDGVVTTRWSTAWRRSPHRCRRP